MFMTGWELGALFTLFGIMTWTLASIDWRLKRLTEEMEKRLETLEFDAGQCRQRLEEITENTYVLRGKE